MANWAFLSCTADRRTYPSYTGKPQYRAVLSAAWHLPVLWWAIFRPADLVLDRSARKAGDGDPVPAPVVPRSRVKQRLAEALSRVEKLYPKGGSLSRHADLLVAALERAPQQAKYVTLEHVETAAYFQPGEFQQVQADILAYMAGRKVRAIQMRLRPFTAVANERKFNLPDEVTEARFTKADRENLYGLLGQGAQKLAPWQELKPRPPHRSAKEQIQQQLIDAVRSDKLMRAKVMLEQGASPLALDKYRFNALEYAIMHGSDALVRLILEAAGQPPARPMCIAADKGSARALRLLLSAGGNPQAFATSVGYSRKEYALSYAATSDRNSQPKVKLLLDRGADVNARNEQGESCLTSCYEVPDAMRLMLPNSTKRNRQQTVDHLRNEITHAEEIGLPRRVKRLKKSLRLVERHEIEK